MKKPDRVRQSDWDRLNPKQRMLLSFFIRHPRPES